mgnify:FL=1
MKSKQVQEFKKTKIGDVCPFVYGKGLPERERNIGKIQVYGSNGIIGWHDKSFLNGPSIIIGRKGSIGKIHYSENPCWPIDTTFYIVENENFHLKFIFYLLKFLNLENMDSDTSVPGLNRNAAHELEINIPEKKVQIRTSTVLENLDTKISNLQNQNHTLEQMVQAIFKSWFVDFDGIAEFEDSDLGQIPKGWKAVKLGEHTKIKGRIGWKGLTQSEYSDKGYHLVTGKQLTNGTIDWDNCPRVSEERYFESPEIMLKENDILMSKDGTIGRLSFIFKLNQPSSVGTGIFVIRPNSELIDHYFLLSFFKSDIFKSIVYSRIEGSVIPHLYQRDINDFDFPLPPKPLLIKFSKISKHITNLQYQNIFQIQNLRKIRDILLPKLMSGKIRV